MRQTRTNRLLALLLSVLMLVGCAVPAFAADDAKNNSTGELVEVSDTLSFITYEEYLSKYLTEEDNIADFRANGSFTVSATEYDEEKTTAVVNVIEHQGEAALETAAEGSVTWNFTVPETGFYTISVRYAPTTELSSGIERIFYINDKVPFQESRHLQMLKTWKFGYATEPVNDKDVRDGIFEKDGGGNELRPDCIVSYAWEDFVIKDPNGYYTTPFEFYLEEGENSITFESIRDKAAIASFTFAPYVGTDSYADVYAEWASKGYTEATDATPIYIHAETPTSVSDYTQFPVTDRTSAITLPQDASLTMLNTIGREKWNTNGQWIQYTFEVEKDGLYVIAPRFKQSIKNGIFVSREVRIDGELPFTEASSIRFNFGKEWQVAPLSDDEGNPYEFYLTAGKHTVEFEVSLGDLSAILQQATRTAESINQDYLEITKLTGQEADENRDYGFARIMPEVVADLSVQSSYIKAIVQMIASTSGVKSENTGTLETMAELLRKMGADESKIAPNLSDLAEQISSLGEWVNEMKAQPLEMDYILIQPASAELPKANDNFFQSFGHEIKKFVASFFSDYSALAEDSEEGTGYAGHLTVWTSSGRDQAQIINNLIKDGFAKEENVDVTLKLTAGNTLLLAILAGIAPDVSIDATTPLEMAVRGALNPLDDFENFDEVISRFTESAMVPLRLFGETYAIPTNQSFAVMFYRTDILADLGMEPPKTWDELMSLVPILQFNNMNVGLSANFPTFIYQYGGSYWGDDDGMKTHLDDSEALDAIEIMMSFFTQYSLPIAFNGVARMKTGEMPIIIGEYTQYNTLVVSAPEIAGLWTIEEIPGFVEVDENGEEYIDNKVSCTSSGVIMPVTVENPDLAWKFMCWMTDKEYQVDYSNEMVSLLGSSAKQPVANLEAFEELPWTTHEKNVLRSALEKSVGVEAYPGDYIIVRYINFVYNKAYSDKESPSALMQEYASSINKELSRKRKEFKLMVAEEWEAVKAYMGFESYPQWKEYASENGIESYSDWMKEQGISVRNYEDWEKQSRHGETTLDYKAWIAEN